MGSIEGGAVGCHGPQSSGLDVDIGDVVTATQAIPEVIPAPVGDIEAEESFHWLAVGEANEVEARSGREPSDLRRQVRGTGSLGCCLDRAVTIDDRPPTHLGGLLRAAVGGGLRGSGACAKKEIQA